MATTNNNARSVLVKRTTRDHASECRLHHVATSADFHRLLQLQEHVALILRALDADFIHKLSPGLRARRVARHMFSGTCRSASARQYEARRRPHNALQYFCFNTVACAQPLWQRRMEPAPVCPTTRLERDSWIGTVGCFGWELTFVSTLKRTFKCSIEARSISQQRMVRRRLIYWTRIQGVR